MKRSFASKNQFYAHAFSFASLGHFSKSRRALIIYPKHPSQDILGCCGVDSFDDWSKSQSLKTNSTTTSDDQYDLPSTCCIQLSPPEEFFESPSELFCHSNLPTTLSENTTSEMEFLRIYDSGNCSEIYNYGASRICLQKQAKRQGFALPGSKIKTGRWTGIFSATNFWQESKQVFQTGYRQVTDGTGIRVKNLSLLKTNQISFLFHKKACFAFLS